MQTPEPADTITYSHSREALIAHVARHIKPPKAASRSVSIWTAILGVCLILLNWSDKTTVGLLALVFLVVLPLYYEFALFPHHVKVQHGKGVDENPLLLAQRRVSFDENGIEITVENSTTRDAWAAFESYDEDETNFYLKSRGMVLPGMIPKRAFQPAQLERFSRLIKQIGKQPPKL